MNPKEQTKSNSKPNRTGKPKGQNISIYLKPEHLRYLDQLCIANNVNRSEMVQQLIIELKNAALATVAAIALLGHGDKPELAALDEYLKKRGLGS